MVTDAERKARAEARAATLPPGEYHAWDNSVARFAAGKTERVIECESHWDACLVLLAIGREG
jgi:hypothetical protein